LIVPATASSFKAVPLARAMRDPAHKILASTWLRREAELKRGQVIDCPRDWSDEDIGEPDYLFFDQVFEPPATY
jgi:hypothetical protein